MAPRAVEVGDQARDRGSVVVQELDTVAAERLEVAGRECECGRRIIWSRDRAEHGTFAEQLRLRPADDLRCARLFLTAELRDANAAEDRVQDHAGPGQEEDEQQPGSRGRGRAPLGNVHQHREPNGPLADVVQRAEQRDILR